MSFATAIDELTLEALKRGSRHHQEQIYRTYSAAAWNLAMRLTGCEAMAWDAVQSAFIKTFDRVSQLNQRDQFGFWLRRIVVNQVRDTQRQAATAVAGLVNEITPETNHGQAVDLEWALAKLGDQDRMVLWLHDVEGFKHSEIAELMEQSIPWSKTRLSRARARVRELLHSYQAEFAGRVCHE